VFEESAAEVSSVSYSASCLACLVTQSTEVLADEVRQVCLGKMAPEVLNRVEFGCVGWEVFDLEPRTLLLQEALDFAAAMCGKPIPQQDGIAASKMPFQNSQVVDDLRLFDRAGMESQAKSYTLSCRCGDQAGDGRNSLPVKRCHQDRSAALWSPRTMNRRTFGEAAFIQEYQDCAAISCLFLIVGQRCLSQRRIARSLRSRARDSGRWQLQPSSPRSFQTCPG
jgi:hypothetical protein